MSTTARRRERVKPVAGTVRWLRPLVVGRQLGRLAITAGGQTTEYDVGIFDAGDGRIAGLGLAKDDDEVYAIDVSQPHGWACDCPDAQFRGRECKHVRAVRAALAAAGIDLPPAEPQPPTCDPDDF